MKLLLDEQISGKVAARLRARDYDVLAVTSDPTLRGLSDPAVFEFAQEQQRAVLTYNRDDFTALAREYGRRGEEHHGLVIANPKRLPNWELGRLVTEIARLLDTFQPYPSFYIWIPLQPR